MPPCEKPEAAVGWWIDTLAIDPFDSKHVCYATGATIWNTVDMNNADSGGDTHWTIWADGIEETAILCLISPTGGAHLISGFGDISGFTHDDLDVSPPQGPNRHPLFANNSWLDFAEKNPNVVVRMGSRPFHPPDEGTMAYSLDGGHNWKPFTLGAQRLPRAAGGGGGGGGRVILSADGSVFMSTGGTPRISTDHGATWKEVTGLPAGVSPIADRSNAAKFYALGFGGASNVSEHRRRGDVHEQPTKSPACLQREAAAGRGGRWRRRDWSPSGAGRETFGLLDKRSAIRAMAAGPSRKSPTIRRLAS